MNKAIRYLMIFLIPLFLILFLPNGEKQTFAQTTAPTPQKVIAINHFINPEGQKCAGYELDTRLEVWNVGAEGGDQYKVATMTSTGLGGECDDEGVYHPGSELKTQNFTGTFSGGPNGKVLLKQVFTEEQLKYINNQEYIDMVYVLNFVNGEKVTSSHWPGSFIVQNPEAFTGVEQPEPTATPGQDCTPQVSGLSGLKPGDVLSPSVNFIDHEGKPVAPISSVWYINGKQTYSTTWDGKETSLELQYTCPDNAAHSKKYIVPAFVQGQPAQIEEPPSGQTPTQPNEQSNSFPISFPGNLSPVVVAGGLLVAGIVIAGVAVAGVAVVVKVLTTGAPVVKTPVSVPPLPLVSPQVPPSPVSPPSPTIPQPPQPVTQTPSQQPKPHIEEPQGESQGENEGSKNPLQAAKDAADNYAEGLEDGIKQLEALKDFLEKDKRLSDEALDSLTKKIEGFSKAANNVKEMAESFSSHVDDITKIPETLTNLLDSVKNLRAQVKDLADSHTKMLHDLKDLPPEIKNQIADISTVIEIGGRGVNVLVNKLPYGEHISKALDVEGTTKDAVKAVENTVKNINKSKIIENETSNSGKDPIFSDNQEKGWTPEMEKIHQEAIKNQTPGPIDKISKWIEQITGNKPVDQSVIDQR